MNKDVETEEECNKIGKRIGRRSFLAFSLLLAFIYTVFEFIIDLKIHIGNELLYVAINSTIFIILSILNIILSIKRIHDINKSAWLLLLLIIPFINFWIFYLLIFKKGTDKENKYGPVPCEFIKSANKNFKHHNTFVIIFMGLASFLGNIVLAWLLFPAIQIEQEINSLKLPIKINSKITITNAWREGGTIYYEYSGDYKMQGSREASIKKIRNLICNEKTTKKILNSNVSLGYIYKDLNGNKQLSLTVSKKDCNQ